MKFDIFGFVLRFLIHLDLSFVHSNEYKSTRIFLHANFPVDLNNLLKMLDYSPVCIFVFFIKIRYPQLYRFMSPLQLSFIDQSGCFYANTMVFYCYSSGIQFEFEDGDTSDIYYQIFWVWFVCLLMFMLVFYLCLCMYVCIFIRC